MGNVRTSILRADKQLNNYILLEHYSYCAVDGVKPKYVLKSERSFINVCLSK